MSDPTDNLDEYEEVGDDEDGKEEEEEDDDLDVAAAPITTPAVPTTTPVPINDELPEPPKRPNNVSGINNKRSVNKKAMSIAFLQHFAAHPNKTLTEIAEDLHISKSVANKYLDEYATVVLDAVEKNLHPDMVLVYYNDFTIPEAQRLTALHVQQLKPVLIRYKKVNVDNMLGKHKTNDATSIANEIVEEEIRPPTAVQGQYKTFNEFMEERDNVNTNPRTISENSPIGDILHFGLVNSGANDESKIRKVKAMFMSAPPFYLADEQRFKDLLDSNGISAKSITAFIDWFKNVAPIRPSERVGFLNLLNRPANVAAVAVTPTQQQSVFSNFNIKDYDDYAQYLYHEGVFVYGLPPDHRVNQENYKKWQDKKRRQEEQEELTEQMNMAQKRWILELQKMGMGGMNGSGGAMQQNNQGIALDERYLFERGILLPEITYNENGQKITRWIPTGRSLYGNMDPQQQQQQQPDKLAESVNMFSRLIEALRPLMQPQNTQQQQQNPLIDKVLTAVLEKSLNKVEESPMKTLETQMNLVNQMKQMFPTTENRPLDENALKLQLEMEKIRQDGTIAEKEISIKEKMWELEQRRFEEQKNESKDNISMIFDLVAKGLNYASPLLQTILMGQMGGGLSNMMGGMMGGGMPGGPGGGMMPGGPSGGMEQMMPPMQQPNPFVQQDNGIIDDNMTPDMSQIPPEFMPNQQQQQQPEPLYQPQPPPPTQYYQPQPQPQPIMPEPVYQPQPPSQYYYPPQQQQSEPTVSDESNFLDSLTVEQLSNLDTSQLDDVLFRMESKSKKFEKVKNMIKSVKAKKQFGYNTVRKQTANNDEYPELDVPKNIPPDYTGLPDNDDNNIVQQQYKETTIIEEQQPSFSSNKVQTPQQPVTINEFVFDETQGAGDNQDFFLNDDNYNNEVFEINDMGNDIQQFNQQNNINDPEFIKEQEAKRQHRERTEKLARLQALGCNNVNFNNVHLFDETGKLLDVDPNTDAFNDPAGPTNRDTFQHNPNLDIAQSHPSEQFQKDQPKPSKTNSKQDKEDNQKEVKKEQQEKVPSSAKSDKSESDLFFESTKKDTKTAVVDNNNVFGQKDVKVENNAYKNKKQDNK